MSLANFIPEVWSARLLVNLRDTLVYAQDMIINRDYEGEISNLGDTVHINSIGAVTIGDYTKNTDIGNPENLTSATQALSITQSKFFNFQVDDIDKVQTKPKVMNEAMGEAAYGLAYTADQFVGGLYTGISATNTVGTAVAPIAVTSSGATGAYEQLVALSVRLDEANVPESGRWVVVPPWFHGLLLLDERFIKSGTPSADNVLRNGQVGEAAGFTVLKSNAVPMVTNATPTDVYKVIAGHRFAWSYAEQINQVEAYRPEKRFADALKGLHLYGAKVVRPTGLALLHAAKG